MFFGPPGGLRGKPKGPGSRGWNQRVRTSGLGRPPVKVAGSGLVRPFGSLEIVFLTFSAH